MSMEKSRQNICMLEHKSRINPIHRYTDFDLTYGGGCAELLVRVWVRLGVVISKIGGEFFWYFKLSGAF